MRSALRGRALLWLPLIALALTPLLLMWLPLPVSHELEVEALLSTLPQRCERVALYMGYPACQTECPVTLHTLASHEQTRCERCCVLFVNLYERGDQGGIDPAQRYLNGFNVSPEWRGVSPSREVRRALEVQLSTRSEQIKKTAGEPPQLSHSDLVWLLKRPPRSSQGGAYKKGEEGAWRLVGFTRPARFSWFF